MRFRKPCQSLSCNILGGFIHEDHFVFPDDKPSTLLYEAVSNPTPWTGWDCAGLSELQHLNSIAIRTYVERLKTVCPIKFVFLQFQF